MCGKMNKNLLIDMFYAAPEFWYVLGGVFLAMLVMLCVLSIRVLKARQRNYFLNRDRERYAERFMPPRTAILRLFIRMKKSTIRAKILLSTVPAGWPLL